MHMSTSRLTITFSRQKNSIKEQEKFASKKSTSRANIDISAVKRNANLGRDTPHFRKAANVFPAFRSFLAVVECLIVWCSSMAYI